MPIYYPSPPYGHVIFHVKGAMVGWLVKWMDWVVDEKVVVAESDLGWAVMTRCAADISVVVVVVSVEAKAFSFHGDSWLCWWYASYHRRGRTGSGGQLTPNFWSGGQRIPLTLTFNVYKVYLLPHLGHYHAPLMPFTLSITHNGHSSPSEHWIHSPDQQWMQAISHI